MITNYLVTILEKTAKICPAVGTVSTTADFFCWKSLFFVVKNF